MCCCAVLRGDIARIVVGEGANIQDNATCHVDVPTPCVVGNYVTVGHGAILHGCTIRDEVLIGMGAVVMDLGQTARELYSVFLQTLYYCFDHPTPPQRTGPAAP